MYLFKLEGDIKGLKERDVFLVPKVMPPGKLLRMALFQDKFFLGIVSARVSCDCFSYRKLDSLSLGRVIEWGRWTRVANGCGCRSIATFRESLKERFGDAKLSLLVVQHFWTPDQLLCGTEMMPGMINTFMQFFKNRAKLEIVPEGCVFDVEVLKNEYHGKVHYK